MSESNYLGGFRDSKMLILTCYCDNVIFVRQAAYCVARLVITRLLSANNTLFYTLLNHIVSTIFGKRNIINNIFELYIQ